MACPTKQLFEAGRPQKTMACPTQLLIEAGRPLKNDGLPYRDIKRAITRLQREYKPVIARYAEKRARNKRCRGMARNLLKAWPALWNFASHDGVTPTNNHAERGLRSAVIYRKLSLGTQSEQGERRIERLLSAHTTCRLQHRSLFAYLTDALTTHAHSEPAPLLT